MDRCTVLPFLLRPRYFPSCLYLGMVQMSSGRWSWKADQDPEILKARIQCVVWVLLLETYGVTEGSGAGF